MTTSSRRYAIVTTFLIACVTPQAYAQMAVIDVQSISALQQQIQAWQNQLLLMQNMLKNQTLNRGYANQLRLDTPRLNYLPKQWSSPSSATGLSDQAVLGLKQLNSRINGLQSASLAPDTLTLLGQWQLHNAQSQLYAQQAYAQSTQRVDHLNQLIDQIATTHDPQSSAELQARLQGESLLLLNEIAKLLTLLQTTAADRQVLSQQAKEQNLNHHGNISERFHPTPPGG